MKSLTRRLVERHPQGKLVESVLNTPEGRRAYEERMEEVSRDRIKADQRARALSWLHARDRLIL
jgi:hypothetical protein